jgi:hypothetical protein
VTARSHSEPPAHPDEALPLEGESARSAEQEVVAGQSEATPILALSTVIVAVAALVLVGLAAAALAYWLA